MELTVGVLKEIIKDLPDHAILSYLSGNHAFHTFMGTKRVLLLQGNLQWDNRLFLTINPLGSHFSGQGDHKDLTFTGQFWDQTNLPKPEQ